MLVLGLIVPVASVAVVATVLAQERRFDRGSNGNGSGSGRERTDRGDRTDRGGDRRAFRGGPSTSPSGTGSPGSSTRPTTSPSGERDRRFTPGPSSRRPTSGPALPEEFAILTRRSIFVRDRQRLASVVNAPQTTPTTTPSAPREERVRPETGFVLRGFSLVEGFGYVALIEHTESGITNATEYHVGDRIATGRVADMSLDGLAYEANGKVTRILIGQNLDGVVVPSTYVAPTTQRVAGTGAPPAPGAPGAPSAAPGAPGASPAPLTGGGSLEEQMRRRRQQETGR
jgi:hypothetical protein